MLIIKNEDLRIEKAVEEDIGYIMEIENDPVNRDFIWQGTYEEHLKEISCETDLLTVIRHNEDDRRVGYVLAKVNPKSEVFEFRRIAIAEKGMGFGRQVLKLFIKYCFEILNYNRFWLDVYPDNLIGLNLYRSLGMHHDGTLRQSYKSTRGYLDQMIFSLLKEEYFNKE